MVVKEKKEEEEEEDKVVVEDRGELKIPRCIRVTKTRIKLTRQRILYLFLASRSDVYLPTLCP